MFKANPKYREQLMEKSSGVAEALVEKSTEVAEVLAERLHELSRQAEKQAGALEARVKKPKRRNRILGVLAWTTLLVPLGAAAVYGVRRYLQAEDPTTPPFGSRVADYPASAPGSQSRLREDDGHAYDGLNGSRTATDVSGSGSRAQMHPQTTSTSDVEPAFEDLVGKDVVD